MTTNIIRGPLIDYTQEMCAYYEIPLEEVSSGPIWNPNTLDWFPQIVHQPVADGRRLLLVPKAIVRLKMDYNPDE
jgi:hypothetical protein